MNIVENKLYLPQQCKVAFKLVVTFPLYGPMQAHVILTSPTYSQELMAKTKLLSGLESMTLVWTLNNTGVSGYYAVCNLVMHES